MNFRDLLRLFALHRQTEGHFKAAVGHVLKCAKHFGAQQFFVENMLLSDEVLNNFCVTLSGNLGELKFSQKNQQALPHASGRFIVHNKWLNDFEPEHDLPKVFYPLISYSKNGKSPPKGRSVMSDLESGMNVILRDSHGNCQGGLCAVKQDGDLRRIVLQLLFVKDDFRWRGMGKRIMEIFHSMCLDDPRRIWTYPTSFHNTAFLEKVGYTRAASFPKVLVGYDGLKAYDQHKYIFSPPLD